MIFNSKLSFRERVRRLIWVLPVLSMMVPRELCAQATEIVVETYAENIGMQGTVDLTGYNTYRIYAKFASDGDFLSAVYGDVDFPTKIQAGNHFFQSAVGGLTNANYNSLLFGGFPDLEYDSFVTIGMAAPADVTAGEESINSVGDPGSDWQVAFEPGFGTAGSDIIIDTQTGGSWFSLYPNANAFAGPDSLVMIGQFTTNNVLYGVVSIATFANGDQADLSLVTLTFSSLPEVVFGCLDANALNYNPEAEEDDGSCIYACDAPATQLVITAASADPVSCSGFSDGGATIEVVGGQGGLVYSNGEVENATGLFFNQPAGAVVLTVTDAQGCSVDTMVMVGTPDPLDVGVGLSSAISCTGASDGVLTGAATGGTGPVVYSLTPPVPDVSGAELVLENEVDALHFDGLDEGLFTVYAMDANGCLAQSSTISIAEPQPFNLYAQAVAPTTCPDSEDGTVVLNFFGGSGNSTTYSMDGMAFSTETTYVLAPGTYTFYAQDINGCPDTLSDVTVLTPDPIVIEFAVEFPSCFNEADGVLQVLTAGGTSPYQIELFAVEGVAWTGEDSNGFDVFDSLFDDEYVVSITDDNGCEATAGVELLEPSPIAVLEGEVTPAIAGSFNGAIDILVDGGTPPYGFVWRNAGDEVVSFDEDPTGLSPGTYSVTVTDANGCVLEGPEWFVPMEDLPGCTDGVALNFEPVATIEDGSCIYPTCDSVGAIVEEGIQVTPDAILGVVGVAMSRELALDVGGLFAEPASGSLFAVLSFEPDTIMGLTPDFDLEFEPGPIGPGEGVCMQLTGLPVATQASEVVIEGQLVVSVFGNALDAGRASASFSLTVAPNPNPIPGCLYPNAANYVPFATVEDGSCAFPGCMNPQAVNYSPRFNEDDGTCVFPSDFGGFDGDVFCRADFDGSGLVGSADLLLFLGAFEGACE